MKKYTVSVNEYEYCVGIFEKEKEAWDKAISLFKERYASEYDYTLFDNDNYHDDLVWDIISDGYYNVLEIEVK